MPLCLYFRKGEQAYVLFYAKVLLVDNARTKLFFKGQLYLPGSLDSLLEIATIFVSALRILKIVKLLLI